MYNLNPTSNQPSEDRPEPLLSDGQGGILIPGMLYRCFFNKEPCKGRIVCYSGGGYFANSANEIIEVDYDYLASVILRDPTSFA